MKLKRAMTSSMFAVLMVAGNIRALPVQATSVSPQQLAQVTPRSLTGRLDENSQILNDGSYYNIHTFEGIVGQEITIDLVSRDFDAYLMLLGPSGNMTAENDDHGIIPASTASRIIIRLPETGTYQIIVNSSRSGETGHYILSWQSSESAPCVPVYKQPQSKSLSNLKNSDSLEVAQLTPELIEADRLGNLAAYLVRARCYEEAIPLAEEALTLYRIALGDTHHFIAGYLHNLAQMYVGVRRYREAETYFLESINIYYKQPEPLANYPTTFDLFNLSGLTQGRRTHNIVDSLNELSSLYREQGRYDEAESILQAMGSSAPAPIPETDSPELASLYLSQGRYDEAETLFFQSLADNLRRFGPPAVYGMLDKDDLDVSDLLMATEIDFSTGYVHHRTAASIGQIAYLYHLQGRNEEAEQFFLYAEKAVDYFIESPGLYLYTTREYTDKDVHGVFATILNSLGIFRSTQGRYREAESFYISSLELIYAAQFNAFTGNILGTLEDIDLSNYPFEFSINFARTLGNLANVYYFLGRHQEAEQIYQKLLDFYRQEFGKNHPNVSVQLSKLSIASQRVGDIEQSRNFLEQALAAEEYNLSLNLAVLADSQRQAYTATISGSTQRSLSLHLQSAPTSPEVAELALTTLLRRKGRILDASADSLQRLRQNLTSEDQATLDRLIDTQRQLANLTFNPPPDLVPEQYRARLSELEAEANQLETTLTRRSAVFRAETEPVTLAAVQAQIPANSVLVEYVRYQPFNVQDPQNSWGNPRYGAYLLFPDGRIEAVDLGNASEIDAVVESLTRLLQNPRVDFQARATAVIQVNLRRGRVENITNNIRSLIYDPIAAYLGNREHLLISPDSRLNLLPFEALQTEDGRYLVEQYQISYLNSGRDLLRLGGIESSNAPAVILANPDYDLAGVSGDISIGEVSNDLSQFRVQALPGTAREAEALRSLLPNAEILTEQYATEQALKQVQSPGILHIATHGFFLENQASPIPDNSLSIADTGSFRAFPGVNVAVENPLLRSGLALAGFNQRSSGSEDGVFTALEAANLNLSGTQLVVLSACDTGLGDIANGEGVYGLRRAFAIAGAESQLMSLWQVSDDGTQSLMARYYENLIAGVGRSEALRAVQLEMIQEGGEYAHPYYWAAFILSGNWQPLEGR